MRRAAVIAIGDAVLVWRDLVLLTEIKEKSFENILQPGFVVSANCISYFNLLQLLFIATSLNFFLVFNRPPLARLLKAHSLNLYPKRGC